MFSFCRFQPEYYFWVDLVETTEIVSLSSNLVPTITHKIFQTDSSLHVK